MVRDQLALLQYPGQWTKAEEIKNRKYNNNINNNKNLNYNI